MCCVSFSISNDNILMKNIVLFLAFCFTFGLVSAQPMDKKELKQLKKMFQVYDSGKIFKKAKRIALPGVNLRFKLVSRESVTDGSWKDRDGQMKFSAWAILSGMEAADFQEITDQFEVMLTDKLTRMGLEVVPPAAYQNAKNYKKLVEKNTRDRTTSKKNWGAALVFSAGERPFFVFPMSPLGPHAKFAKEVKALVANMLITIDFAYVGFEVDRYSGRYYKSVSSKATVVPVIRLEGMTQNELQQRSDGTYMHVIADQSGGHQLTLNTEFVSDLEFSSNIETCSDCMPLMAKSFWMSIVRGSNNMGTYQVTADKTKYKAAVLDALDRFSDIWIKIYAAQQK